MSMRRLVGFSLVLLVSSVLSAQNRSGFVATPGVVRSFGSVVFPGGTSAMPGVQRTTGSVVFPGGGGPQIGVPSPPLQGLGYTNFTPRNGIPGIGYGAGTFGNGNGGRFANGNGGKFGFGGRRNRDNNNSIVYAYPVFVGGGYYGGDYYDNGYGAPPVDSSVPVQPQQQQPNIVVIYPSAPAPAAIYPSEPGSAPSGSLYQPPATQPSAESQAADEQATHYLIAFKDHTIYSAVAYWVDGDTLHYFTAGNTHNQASLSLVDRALTEKLNQDSGLQVKLPPAR